jgi:hypothetical protein
VFTKNRGHRLITFEEAHEQAQDPPELSTQRAAETPGSTPVQQTAKRAG